MLWGEESGMTETPGLPLLALSGITKQFPGALANDAVDLTLEAREIHALLGENGAGKSTLVKIIYGVLRADAGSITWRGERVEIPEPAAARALGIGMVFQHFSLFEAMTVAENISLGVPAEMAADGLEDRIVEISTAYGLPLDPKRDVHGLSVGERQRIEIVRCLLQEPQLIIMDEPTSVLTPQEADKLFETLRRLADEGCAILYISHRLEEIRALCHKATIMRSGRVVSACDPTRETARSLAEMMMGEDLQSPSASASTPPGAPLLAIDDLSLPSGEQFGVGLRNLSLEVRAGEILGIAGIAGNGQAELMGVLSGETLCPLVDAITANGVAVGRTGPDGRRALGMAFVPEERLGHGAVPDMSLWENTLVSARRAKKLLKYGFILNGRAQDYAGDIVERFNVKTAGVGHNASSLSGGNLQKFVIGREILLEPRILVAIQPTWGVDAGSAAAIRQALIDLAARGAAVLVISQDLDELMEVSSRIAVMSEGRLSEPRAAAEVTVEQIGLLMGGAHDLADASEGPHA